MSLNKGFEYSKHFKRLLYEWRDKTLNTESEYGSFKLVITKTGYQIQTPACWPDTGRGVVECETSK